MTYKSKSLPNYEKRCNIQFATYVVQELCDAYAQKFVVGSMCASLCNPRNKFKNFEVYHLVGCYNYDGQQNPLSMDEFEFKTVLVYEVTHKRYINADTPERIVLKSAHKSIFDFDTRIDSDFDTKSIDDQLKFLAALIRQSLVNNYGVQVDDAMIDWLRKYLQRKKVSTGITPNKKDIFYYVNLLATKNYDTFENVVRNAERRELARFIKNLALLLSQEEYLFSKYFAGKNNTLNVYGTCGHFYAIEHAESLGSQVKDMNANDRKKLAVKFLDLVKNFDTQYLPNYVKVSQKTDLANKRIETFQESQTGMSIPMQICDVKLENFGLTSEGELKVIDLDMIHPDSFLYNPKYCEKHEDCHFFDCKSYCDLAKRKCHQNRINDNLQAVCEKIFNNQYFKEDALLIGTDFGDDGLTKLLVKQCAEPSFFNQSNIPLKAGNDRMFEKLQRAMIIN